MRQRCYNPNQPSYPRYGGRGIRACKRWRDSFESFLADMGPRPTPKHAIERLNNDGDYTRKEQANNRRTSIPKNLAKAALRGYDSLPRCPSGKRVLNGEIAKLAERLGIPAGTIKQLDQTRKREVRNAANV